MHIDLSGVVVLVTGASRGIGRAVALQLGKAGAVVAAHYNRNREAAGALLEQLPESARAFQADLEDPEQCTRLFADVLDAYGRFDVLINNAGVAHYAALDSDDDHWLTAWTKTIDINLRATGLLCRAAIRHFLERGQGGRIVNISSRAAFRGDTADYMAYAASKGGMVALTRTIARAYGKEGIMAFDVAPGFTRTDMAQDFFDTYGEEYALNNIALPRLTEPEDVANIVIFLASGLADHATGTSIDVNAGSYVH